MRTVLAVSLALLVPMAASAQEQPLWEITRFAWEEGIEPDQALSVEFDKAACALGLEADHDAALITLLQQPEGLVHEIFTVPLMTPTGEVVAAVSGVMLEVGPFIASTSSHFGGDLIRNTDHVFLPPGLIDLMPNPWDPIPMPPVIFDPFGYVPDICKYIYFVDDFPGCPVSATGALPRIVLQTDFWGGVSQPPGYACY